MTNSATEQIKNPTEINLRKRLRIYLRCQNPMPKKDRCEHCRINFCGGGLMKVLKKILEISVK
jgi:hypothetical protein